MPKYNPTDEDMDQSYSAPVKKPAPSAKAETVDEENAGASEILVSKDKLPEGIKEGETCTFTVTKDYGDEVSLTYSETEKPQTPSMEDQTANEISALDTEKG